MLVLLAIAASKSWFLHQPDVDSAFLHGDLNIEVYMEPPPSLNIYKKDQVCILTKSLYDLKQASRQWLDKLSSFLISVNFTQSKFDCSLFFKKTTTNFTNLIVYVDDIILARNSITKIQHIKDLLHNSFQIKQI